MVPEVRKPHGYLILAYHRINRFRNDGLTVSTPLFRQQLEHLLRSGYRNVDLEDLTARVRSGEPPNERLFALTFDDGYRDICTEALPILKQMRCRATFFLPVDYIGAEKPFPWDVGKFPLIEPADVAMNDREVVALLDAGMSIGSHSCSHPLLADLPLPRVQDEVERSKLLLARRFGVPVRTFCYPAGSLDERVVRCVADAGYVAGVVTPPRTGVPETMFTLKRVGIYYADTLARFRMKIHPLFSRVREMSWYPRTRSLRTLGARWTS